MKLIFSLLVIFILQLAFTDASGKTNPRSSTKSAQLNLPVSLHQSPRARLVRRLNQISTLQSPQQIQQRPTKQRILVQQQLPQRPLQQQLAQRPVKKSLSRPKQQIIIQQQQPQQISKAPRRVKVVRQQSAPQKALKPVQQNIQSVQSTKSLAPKKAAASPKKSQQQISQNQLPSLESNGNLPSGLAGNPENNSEENTGATNSPSNNLNDNNSIGSSNRINANNEINSSNRISASNSIESSNRIGASNSINSANRISAGNAINSSNRIGASNSINSANRINANNEINSSNRISASNSIESSNSINAEEVSTCSKEGYYRDPKVCDIFYQCARLGNGDLLKMFEFQCTGGLVFNMDNLVCDYAKSSESCSVYLYNSSDASDERSYNENELIGPAEIHETSRLTDNEDSNNASNETSELENQPPERSGPATEGTNLTENSNETSSNDEDSW